MVKEQEDLVGKTGKETPRQTVLKIDGVPQVPQMTRAMCGYASLSTVLQFWGHSELTVEKLFEHTTGTKFDRSRQNIEPHPGPSVSTLASVVRELTPLAATILSDRSFRKNGRDPHEALQLLLKDGIPCIIRTPNHFLVATGADLERRTYTFNDPQNGRVVVKSRDHFEGLWSYRSRPDSTYTDASHLMLAIYPRR